MLFRTNNAVSRSIILSCIIFLYEKLKNYSIQSIKECLFFVFCMFCLLLLSNNTLYVMFVCFDWKITWHLDKMNKKVKAERVGSWIDAQSSCFMSFNSPPSLLPKITNKLLLQSLYHFIYDIQTSDVKRSDVKMYILYSDVKNVCS